MADYRCSVKARLSRGKGASVARAAAYIMRQRVQDERTGAVYDYSGNKDKALWTGIFAPKGAPEWASDLQKLCDEIEAAEKRKDAQLLLPIELSLPHELTLEQNRWMLQDFIKENFTRQGYAAIAAIHAPPEGGDQRNIHAHLLVTLRTVHECGFAKTKKQQQENYMARSERVEALRASWEKHLKHHLKRHGFEKEAEAVSCKSLKDQGIDREPGVHIGPAASQMMKRGAKTERGDINQAIEERNRQLEQLKAAEQHVSRTIARVQRKIDVTGMIRGAWKESQGDALEFMIALNEQGLYVAQNNRGAYAAVEKNGFAHRLPDKEMHKAIDALRREHSGLMIPGLEEQRELFRKQRQEARERGEQRRAAHLGATLYDRADMVTMQGDALRHIRDARRLKERNEERRRREAEQEQSVDGLRRDFWQELRELKRDPAEQAREDKKARTEQTEYQQRKAERDAMREQTDNQRGQRPASSNEEEGRERERER